MKLSWYFEKVSKMDKPLARLTKNKRERTQICKSRNERGDLTTPDKYKGSQETTVNNYTSTSWTTKKK